MTADGTLHLQALIDRILAGDRGARRELLNRACDRLRRLAGRMLTESFPALRDRHDLDSVVHETWLRLVQTVEKTDPPTVADFFRLAAFKVRQVLLDMSGKEQKLRRRERLGLSGGSGTDAPAAGRQTYDPARLAAWTDFHEQVAALPDRERAVFEMHFYLDLTQADVARVLNLHPRQVSYVWIEATEKLADALEHLGSGEPAG
ncbi:MAG TPA: sigma-70 family RNA polymerase sigma factor [Gemmataceae bacterium]|jgi:RNA polymerase sigma factor (sigma-70 family)|nr:sigma-70 family RNA polymerase sigma factor [Gemmataceae bacterium]